MKIQNRRDFNAGLMFLGIGLFFGVYSMDYSLGTATRMGPGYFPLLLGVLLAILGGITMFYSLVIETPNGDKVGSFAWRPIGFILGSNLAFGILLGGLPSIKLPSMGLIAAIYALTLIASKAGTEFKLRDVLLLATILAVGSYLAFIVLLKLQMPVWPTFIAG